MIAKITNPLLKLSAVTVGTLAIFNLVGSNLLATQGHELTKTYSQTQLIKKENIRLTNEIAHQSSLASLETWADEHSFIKIDKPIALATPAPVALNR